MEPAAIHTRHTVGDPHNHQPPLNISTLRFNNKNYVGTRFYLSAQPFYRPLIDFYFYKLLLRYLAVAALPL